MTSPCTHRLIRLSPSSEKFLSVVQGDLRRAPHDAGAQGWRLEFSVPNSTSTSHPFPPDSGFCGRGGRKGKRSKRWAQGISIFQTDVQHSCTHEPIVYTRTVQEEARSNPGIDSKVGMKFNLYLRSYFPLIATEELVFLKSVVHGNLATLLH